MADFWLREATAAFEEVRRREAVEGRPAARERLQVLRDAYLGLREASLDRPLAELEPSGRGDAQVARSKGASVLWMLRQAVGPLSFRTIWAGAGGPPTTADALLEHCRAHLARFKVPKAVTFLDALPRNPSGKVLKRDLRGGE